MKTDNILMLLGDLVLLLEEGKEISYASKIKTALKSESELLAYIVSNELWGGSGSIADQALDGNSTLRFKLEKILIRLGEEQMNIHQVNQRTSMWVSVFRDWIDKNIDGRNIT